MRSSQKAAVVKSLIQEFLAEEFPSLSEDQAFLLFSATQLLKPRDISSQSLEEGVTDGTQDGGIDALYVFLNGNPLTNDSPYLDKSTAAVKELSRNPLIEVIVIQAKHRTHWGQSPWQALIGSLPRLLDPEIDESELTSVFNSRVIERSRLYRQAVNNLAVKFPQIAVTIAYTTIADEANVSAEIEASRALLENHLKNDLLQEAQLSVMHVGADSLYQLSSINTSHICKLTFDEIIRTEGNAFLGLVTLNNYLEFLKNEEDLLTVELFDGNVRDFEGTNQVNSSIAKTLARNSEADFWWQNNGITILAGEATCPTKTMTLDSPLVVNGLQTSYILFDSMRKGSITPERLNEYVVVRVIASLDEEVRDSIIAGTNRQTSIPAEALFASGQDQIDIERYFKSQGWFYERRRKHYRNQKVPADRRVEISYLSQAIMTLSLGEPNTARARPTTLLTKENGYDKVFPSKREGDVYLTAARIMKEVDAYLKTAEAKIIFDDNTNARFYVALSYYMLSLRIKDRDVLKFDDNARRVTFPLDRNLLTKSLLIVKGAFELAEKTNPGTPRDTISKRSDFRDLVCDSIAREIPQPQNRTSALD